MRWAVLLSSSLVVALACAPGSDEGEAGSTGTEAESESNSNSESETGDGDGDGDGDPSGDGDGDGDPSGDGDGDGDGDPSDDGDGDPSGDGDGDGAEFGEVIGDCGLVAAELDQPTPSLWTLHFDFRDDPFDDPDDIPLLTPGAQTILTEPNAGGSSIVSEAFAYEVLARCEGASLLETETEILYDPPDSKKTDILVELDMAKVGVSVTRAVGFPPEDPYPPAQAASLMAGKLADILVSSQNVVPEDAWVKQILVVMAYADMHAQLIEIAWTELDDATKADTIVYVVVTDGADTPVYFQ